VTEFDTAARADSTPEGPSGHLRARLGGEIAALDRAIYGAVRSTPTPTLDKSMKWISNAADGSRLWVLIAAALAVVGGRRGRRAAIRGLVAVGVTSATANLGAKQLFPRRRPRRPVTTAEREEHETKMPTSSSFPSGHTASAFAFATTVTLDVPALALPLYGLAAIVGYSRVHNGVHHPSDVMAGGVLGLTVGSAVRAITARHGPLKPSS